MLRVNMIPSSRRKRRSLVDTIWAALAIVSPLGGIPVRIFVLLVSAILVADPGAQAQEKDVAHLMCSDVVSSSGSFTQKTPAMETWLMGYFDGITALSAIDPRVQALRKTDFNQLASVLLASCAAKPSQLVGETVTDLFALFINAQPGVPLELATPRE